MSESQAANLESSPGEEAAGRERTFLIPVPSLTVASAWKLGTVTIHPSSEAARLTARTTSRWSGSFEQDTLAALAVGSILEVSAASPELAIDSARGAVDVLRVFWRWYTRGGAIASDFGLVNPDAMQPIRYLLADGTGVGFRMAGRPYGSDLLAAAERAWASEPVFGAVATALSQPPSELSEGLRRACLGTRLMARALSEATGAVQLVGFMTALEAFLMGGPSGRYRLAQRASYLTCFVGSEWRCREDESPCVFLTINPDTKAGPKQLREASQGPASWLCTVWSWYDRWYQRRSDLVHGNLVEIGTTEVQQAIHWLVGFALPEILRWLVTHPADPIGELEASLRALPKTASERWPPHVAR